MRFPEFSSSGFPFLGARNPEEGHTDRAESPGRNRNHGVDVATIGDTAQSGRNTLVSFFFPSASF